jgi:DNA-binding transcriptional MerR regulator
MRDETSLPLYLSITELSKKIGESASTLRHWETVFTHIEPKKNKKGNRLYDQEQVAAIQEIQQLVRQKGMTLQGAKDFLNQKQVNDKQDVIASLEKLKTMLLAMREMLE